MHPRLPADVLDHIRSLNHFPTTQQLEHIQHWASPLNVAMEKGWLIDIREEWFRYDVYYTRGKRW